MRLPQRSLRRALTPVLVGLHALALASCESPGNPMMAPEEPSYGKNAKEKSNGARGRELTLAAPDSSIAVGEQVQVVLKGPGGQSPKKPIKWSIARTEIATVSRGGLVTGVAPGTTTLSARIPSHNVTHTLDITVEASNSKPPSGGTDADTTGGSDPDTTGGSGEDTSGTPSVAVHMVSISANATTLEVGETTQISGVVRDIDGTPIPNVPVSWSTSPVTVATVASTSPTAGTLTARGVGKATVYAKGDTAVRSITVTVIDSATTDPEPGAPVTGGASGGSYGSATAAELPRASVNTTYPAPNRQVRVPAGASLQAALDAAQPGDELLLAPGAVYSGNFYLRNKGTGSRWITIRTDLSDASIGAPGTRMTPSRAVSAKLAKIVTPNAQSALTTQLGANHYRFTGVEIAVASWVSDINALVRLGETGSLQSSLSSIANYLVFDRTYIHGHATGHLRRCVLLNSATTAIVDSWLGNCHSNVSESQAILGWNGPGPYLIQNNHLEGGHEVIMFGGASTTVQNLSPSDITIRGNHIMRPTSWKGVWGVKNLIESKHARRMLIEGNMIENTWTDGQTGFAFVMKSDNQNWDTPWTQTTDITIRYNRIRNVGGGFNIASIPSGAPAVPAARFVITDNVLENVGVGQFSGGGRSVQLLPGVSDVVVMHNTIVSAGGENPAAVYLAGGGISRLVVHSNVLHHGKAGVKGDGTTEGTASLNRFAPGALYTNNAMAYGGTATLYPSNNWFPSTLADIAFVNLAGGDYHLSSASSFANRGYDGRNIGADIDRVNALTRSAVVGP